MLDSRVLEGDALEGEEDCRLMLNILYKRRDLLICLLLVAITLAVFWQVKDYEFVYLDDNIYLTENPRIHSGLTIESLAWAFTTNLGKLWMPLTWLSFLLDFEVHGLDPGGYHLTNLLFHIANALLLFIVLNRCTGALWCSAFVAALNASSITSGNSFEKLSNTQDCNVSLSKGSTQLMHLINSF